MLLPKLCLLIPRMALALHHLCRERTLLALAHTPSSLRATDHLASQLGELGLSWATTQLLWLLREHLGNLRGDKGQRNGGAQDESSSSLPLPASIWVPAYTHWTREELLHADSLRSCQMLICACVCVCVCV